MGEVLELKRGYDLAKSKRVKGNTPVISSSGVSDFHDKAKVRGPGVVTGRYGTIGEVFYCESDFWPLNTTLYVRDFKGNYPRFVYYFLKTLNFEKFNDKAAVPGINRNHVHLAQVRFPTNYDIQKHIAHILGSFDDKIELNRRMNRTLEQIAQALFKSWFVDFDPVVWNAAQAGNPIPDRFRDTADRYRQTGHGPNLPSEQLALFPASFTDTQTDLGWIPEGWEVGSLYDTARFVNGAAFKSSNFCNPSEGLPVIKIAELKNGVSTQTKYSDKTVKKNQVIRSGDLLYSWSGSPETSLETFVWSGVQGLLNQHIFHVIGETLPDRTYLFYLLKSLKRTLIGIATNKQTTGLGHVTVKDLKRLRVPKPSRGVYDTFNGVAGRYFERSFGLACESDSLRATRDTLLPRLILDQVGHGGKDV